MSYVLGSGWKGELTYWILSRERMGMGNGLSLIITMDHSLIRY